MKKTLIIVSAIILIFVFLFCTLSGVAFAYARNNVDYGFDEELFRRSKEDKTIYYYAKNAQGELIEVYKSSSGAKKEWVGLEDVGKNLIDGFISMEDREFYTHKGLNIKRTCAAAVNHILKLRDGFGGSTITQQLIKNISGDNETNVLRKLREILRALNLERNHSKDDILELYLNVIPFSGKIYGVGAASEIYFGKTPDELSSAEAATLVGITNAPSKYNPYTNPASCIEKRNKVLYAMRETGCLSDEDYKEAIISPLTLSYGNGNFGISSWFIETANEEIISDLSDKYGISRSASGVLLCGSRIVLTMNKDIQDILESYFADTSNLSEKFSEGLNYSMVISDPHTGNLLGIIGGGGEKSAERLFNYATSPVTPGSVLKPLALYAPMIEEGSISWSKLYDDSPLEYRDKEGVQIPYPRNSPDVYDGPIDINDALRKSKNTVAMRLYEQLGPRKIFDHLKNDYSFDSLVEKAVNKEGKTVTDLSGAPLALGQLSYGVSLRRITEAYNVFPANGVICLGRSYSVIYDRNGDELISKEVEKKRIYSVETAQVMNQLLSNVVSDGTARRIRLKEVVDTAGKTGTSGSDRDRLFIGYTPYVCAGIWCGSCKDGFEVGFNNPGHLEIWDRVMLRVHNEIVFAKYEENVLGFDTDKLLVSPYCSRSGCLPNERCELDEDAEIRLGYFSPEKCPMTSCNYH